MKTHPYNKTEFEHIIDDLERQICESNDYTEKKELLAQIKAMLNGNW